MDHRALLAAPASIIRRLEADEVPGLTEPEREIAVARWRTVLRSAGYALRPIPLVERISARTTALLVVDMQRAFVDRGAAIEVPAARDAIPAINWVAAALRKAGGLVVFLRYLVDNNPGLLPHFEGKSYLGPERESPMTALRRGHEQFELVPDLAREASDLVLDKTRFSAVLGSNIEEILRSRGIDTVVVCGVTTDVCAGNTAECLMQRDFFTIMLWDGAAALSRLDHELWCARFFGLYGDVMPSSEVLARLETGSLD